MVQALQIAKVTSHVVFTLRCPKCNHELGRQVTLSDWKQLPSSLSCSHCHMAVHVPQSPFEEGGRMNVWDRDKTLDLFQRQLYALQSKVLHPISKYVLEVQVKGKKYTAIVEGYSHDYWLHRIDLHPMAKEIDFVICYRHNSCLQHRVLELCSPSGREYEAFTTPSWFDIENRSGKAWAQVFTGALLAGYGQAYQILENQIREESPAAYYRYLRRVSQLAAHKPGRPVAV